MTLIFNDKIYQIYPNTNRHAVKELDK